MACVHNAKSTQRFEIDGHFTKPYFNDDMEQMRRRSWKDFYRSVNKTHSPQLPVDLKTTKKAKCNYATHVIHRLIFQACHDVFGARTLVWKMEISQCEIDTDTTRAAHGQTSRNGVRHLKSDDKSVK